MENVSCNVSGSGLELVGVGGATLSGHVEQSGSDFTLEGTDTLTVDITEQRCVGWAIEGTERGMVCAP